MGWRADKAYEEAQAKAYREWKASLTCREYVSWIWDRWWPFVAGATTGIMIFLAVELLTR
jgi:hypothetical protein